MYPGQQNPYPGQQQRGGYPGGQQQGGWGQQPQQPQQPPHQGGGWGQQPPQGGLPGAQQPRGGYPGQPQQPGWGQQPPQGPPGGFHPQQQHQHQQPPPPQQQQQQYQYQGSNNMWYGQQYGGNVQNQEMQNLQQWFWSADTQRRGEIRAPELMNALRYMGHNFRETVANLIISVFDADHSGTITFNEFVPLFKFIQALQQRFQQCDRDRTQTLSFPQNEEALRAEGFSFDQKTVAALFHKFSKGSPGLSFEQFVELACFLGAVRSEFQWRDRQRSGRVSLSLGELVEIVANVSAERGQVSMNNFTA